MSVCEYMAFADRYLATLLGIFFCSFSSTEDCQLTVLKESEISESHSPPYIAFGSPQAATKEASRKLCACNYDEINRDLSIICNIYLQSYTQVQGSKRKQNEGGNNTEREGEKGETERERERGRQRELSGT